MPPIDDELRAALQGRAALVAPPADPMAGIERRARALRRRRTAASVAGTALAVLAVVGVGTTLAPNLSTPQGPAQVATAPPTPTPAPTTTAVADLFALDPAQPWELRGETDLLDENALSSLRREWAARHPGSQAVPLFVQRDLPSGQVEVVLLSSGAEPRWGVARSSEAGWELVVDQPLPDPARALAAALPGDEVARLLVVADPAVGQAEYAPDGQRFRPMSPTVSGAPGVFVLGLEGDPARDRFRVLDGDGDLDAPLVLAPAPDPGGSPPGPAVEDEGPGTAAPANVLEWEPRGTIGGDLVLAARAAWAAERGDGTTGNQVREKVLFAGTDGNRRFLLAQVWLPGHAQAATIGYVQPADGSPQLVPKAPVDDDAPALALQLPASGPQADRTLVVVPRPGTGQVLYGEAGSEFRSVEAPSALDGVVFVQRRAVAEQEGGDVLRLLDGDGREIFTGPVEDLLR